MEFTGKIIWIGEKRQGTSVKGTQWSCREYVIQDASTQYPRTMCFTIFGEDKLNQFNLQLDETLTVSFDIDAHQYQDRWYNSIRAWNIMRLSAPAAAQQFISQAPQQPQQSNDLPF